MFKKFLNFIFPEDYSCLCCGMDVFDNPYVICEDCKKMLPFLKGNICVRCGEPIVSEGMVCKKCKKNTHNFDRAIAPFEYTDEIRSLIIGLKYEKKKYHAKALAKFMADEFLKSNLCADIIVPVPLCEKRLKSRGYNQTELLANELSGYLGIKVDASALIRVKETPKQANLNYVERQTNMKDAFKVKNRRTIKDKSILLIDDVYTTGATVNECARMLNLAGAKAVYVLTAAHTLINNEEE